MRPRWMTGVLAAAGVVSAALGTALAALPNVGRAVPTAPMSDRIAHDRADPFGLAPVEAEALEEAYELPEDATHVDVAEAMANEHRAIRVANQVEAYARVHAANTLSGIYLRNLGAAHWVNVAFMGRVRQHETRISNLVDHPNLVRVHRARFALRELNELQSRVEGSYRTWRKRGVRITIISVDEIRNVLEIGVFQLDRMKRLALVDEYGGRRVRIVEESPFVLA